MAETDTETTEEVDTLTTETAETVAATDTSPVTETSATVVTPSAQEVERLRLENARLEGELAARREQPRPEPATPVQTYADRYNDINARREAGNLTDLQFAAMVADVRFEERRAAERRQEAIDAPERAAAEDLAGYVTKHPDLAVRGSDLIRKVEAELARRQVRYGDDPTSKRAQLAAVEAVVGGHHLGGGTVDNREFNRRRATPGGGGGPAAEPETAGKTDPLKNIHPEQMEQWKRMGYTRKEMEAEAPFVRRIPRQVVGTQIIRR